MKKLECPKCGQTKGFDVWSTRSCDDIDAWMHCPDCTCIFQPSTGKIKKLEK